MANAKTDAKTEVRKMNCLWCKEQIYDLFSLNRGFGKPNVLVQACDKDCGKALITMQQIRELWFPELEQEKEEKPNEYTLLLNERWDLEYTDEEKAYWQDRFANPKKYERLNNLFKAEIKKEKPEALKNLFETEKPLVLKNLF